MRINVRNLTIIAGAGERARPPDGGGFQIGNVTTGGQQRLPAGATSTSRTPGSLLRKPTGQVVIAQRRQRSSRRSPFRMDTFLPKTAIDYPLLLRKRAHVPGSVHGARSRSSYPNAVESVSQTITATPSFLCLEEGRDEGLQLGGAHPVRPGEQPAASSSSSRGSSSLLVADRLRRGASLVARSARPARAGCAEGRGERRR